MKKIIILLFVLSSFQSYAQYSTTQDSVGLFYDSLIYHLKSRYLFRDSVNWGAVESIKAQALNAGSFGESLAFSTALFDTIDGSHLNLFFGLWLVQRNSGQRIRSGRLSHQLPAQIRTAT